MRLRLEAWEPDYGIPDAPDEAPLAPAEPAEGVPWEPLSDARAHPGPWVFVDGVERVDAFVWVDERFPGVLFSYAVGAVWLGADGVRLVEPVSVRRVFVSPAAFFLELPGGPAYRPLEAPAASREDLLAAAREQRRRAEWALGQRLAEASPDALLFHDGPLFFPKGADAAPARLGYIKSFFRRYLGGEEAGILDRLAPGERTPVFRVPAEARRTPRDFFSWYLRLPLEPSVPYAQNAGLVRVETDARELEEAARLAGHALFVLTRLASSPYRDPRAPANLLPVGGLERELRRRLGSRDLLRRRLLRLFAG